MWVAVCSIMMGSLGYWLQQYRGKCLLFVGKITFFSLAVQLLSIGKGFSLGQDEFSRMPFCSNFQHKLARSIRITRIVMTQTHYIARCHCGGVQLALTFPEGVNNVRRCDCSMCRRRGAPVASVSLANLKLVSGAELTSCYQFNTHTAKHYFCSRCGIYTHHQRRSNPEEYGVNLGCIDELDPFAFKDAPVMDGINHPADREAS